jgi:hypothetical protein
MIAATEPIRDSDLCVGSHQIDLEVVTRVHEPQFVVCYSDDESDHQHYRAFGNFGSRPHHRRPQQPHQPEEPATDQTLSRTAFSAVIESLRPSEGLGPANQRQLSALDCNPGIEAEGAEVILATHNRS